MTYMINVKVESYFIDSINLISNEWFIIQCHTHIVLIEVSIKQIFFTDTEYKNKYKTVF